MSLEKPTGPAQGEQITSAENALPRERLRDIAKEAMGKIPRNQWNDFQSAVAAVIEKQKLLEFADAVDVLLDTAWRQYEEDKKKKLNTES